MLRYATIHPSHLDPDTVERAHLARRCAERWLDLPPLVIEFVVPEAELPAGMKSSVIHDRDARHLGWWSAKDPHRIFIHAKADEVVETVIHEARHVAQWLRADAELLLDPDAREADADLWAKAALHYPVP